MRKVAHDINLDWLRLMHEYAGPKLRNICSGQLWWFWDNTVDERRARMAQTLADVEAP